jgi:hypothetical protein
MFTIIHVFILSQSQFVALLDNILPFFTIQIFNSLLPSRYSVLLLRSNVHLKSNSHDNVVSSDNTIVGANQLLNTIFFVSSFKYNIQAKLDHSLFVIFQYEYTHVIAFIFALFSIFQFTCKLNFEL